MPEVEVSIVTMLRTQRAERIAAAALALPVEAKPTPDGKAKPLAFKTAYVDENQGVIYLIGAYAENVDLDDEILKQKALVTMAYDFTSSSKRTFKANHQEKLDADLVASMPGAPILKSGRTIKAGEELPADDPIVGINIEKGNEIAWFVGVRPHDAAVTELAAKGGIAGASWGAYVQRDAVKE